jgi:sugar phosphate isomerase/epimerase
MHTDIDGRRLDLKSGIMTYCLKNALPDSERNIENLIRLAAEEGFDLEVYSPDLEQGDEDIRKLAGSARKLADECGVEILSFGTGARIGNVHPERAAESMETLKESLEVAEILGAEVISFAAIDSQPVPPNQPKAQFGMRFDRALPYIVEQMQELADEAAGRDLNIALVNHCFLVYLGIHQHWISLLTDRPNAGACVDPGNYLFYTYGSEDPVRETKLAAKYAKLVRAGDWAVAPDDEIVKRYRSPKGQDRGVFNCAGAIFGQGEVDHETCFRILADAGYDGFVSLKVGGTSEAGLLDAIRTSMKNLSEMLASM